MEEATRATLRTIFRVRGVTEPRRAVDVDPTEEILLIPADVFAAIDVATVTNEAMEVLPHKKVWVVDDNPRWKSEPI